VATRGNSSIDKSPNVAIRQPNFDLESSNPRSAGPVTKERDGSVIHINPPTPTPQTAFRGASDKTVGTQTHERSRSPFETYDLLFVKDLVNNLNKDNEVLNANIEDLRTAFLYLHEKHKQLLSKYQRECLNREVVIA